MTTPGVTNPSNAVVKAALRSAYGLALQKLSAAQIEQAILQASRENQDPVMSPSWLQAVVDGLPIDESWLFRDSPLWTFLRRWIVQWISAKEHGSGALRALSLGCSTGQEVFSLAILMARAGLTPASGAYVLGVDSSPQRVTNAQSGVLSTWSVSRSGATWREISRSLLEAEGSVWRLNEAVRALCRFEVGNLLTWATQPEVLAQFDFILCRHVLIYFDQEEAARIVRRLALGLRPGSVLALAPSEGHLLRGTGLDPCGHVNAGRKPLASQARRVAPVATPPPKRSPPAVKPPLPVAAPAKLVMVDEVLSEIVDRWLVVRSSVRKDPEQARQGAREIAELLRQAPPDARVGREGELSVGQLLEALLPLLAALEEP